MERDTLRSMAWRDLPGGAAKLLNILRLKCYGPLCESTKINIPTRSNLDDDDAGTGLVALAKGTGLSPNAVRNNIIVLNQYGFLDIVKKGIVLYDGNGKQKPSSNVYRLSRRFENYGQPNFKPGTEKKTPMKRPACGFLNPEYIANKKAERDKLKAEKAK